MSILVNKPRDTDFSLLRSRWRESLTGENRQLTGPSVQGAIESIDSAVSSTLSNIELESILNQSALFDNSNDGKELCRVIRQMRLMACAYRTPNSAYWSSERVLSYISAGLDIILQEHYFESQKPQGNWWEWTIGIPQTLLDVCVLLFDELDHRAIELAVAAVRFHIPDPKINRWARYEAQRQMTGANLTDQVQSLVLASLLLEEEESLRAAVAPLGDALRYVLTGDGLYSDGSFIFHGNIPYNGTYGAVNFRGLSRLSLLLDGLDCQFSTGQKRFLIEYAEKSIFPFIHFGTISGAVRGRAVDRTCTIQDDLLVIADLIRYAEALSPTIRNRWLSKFKSWISRLSDTAISSVQGEHLASNVTSAAALENLKMDETITAESTSAAHQHFPRMARSVHVANNGWQAVLAMLNADISYYETGNGENLRGFHSSSGMLYLNIDEDPVHYSSNFWPRVDPYHLPGTTLEQLALEDGAGGAWGAASSDQVWSGGAVSSGLAAMGMNYVSNTGACGALKSWFFTDSAILCVGSGIYSSSESVHTTMFNRLTGSDLKVLDGVDQTTSEGPAPAWHVGHRWLTLEGVAVYEVRLGDSKSCIGIEPKSVGSAGSRHGETTETSGRRFVTGWIDHGERPSGARYAYAVYPNVSLDSARSDLAPRIRLLEVSETLHAMEDSGLQVIFANVFRKARREWAGMPAISFEQQCSMLIERDDNIYKITMSDPTHTLSSMTVVLHAGIKWVEISDPRIQLAVDERGAVVNIDSEDLIGRSVHLRVCV